MLPQALSYYHHINFLEAWKAAIVITIIITVITYEVITMKHEYLIGINNTT